MLKHRQYIYIYIFSCATLNETFTAKYDSVFALNTLIETKILSPPPPPQSYTTIGDVWWA